MLPDLHTFQGPCFRVRGVLSASIKRFMLRGGLREVEHTAVTSTPSGGRLGNNKT